MDLGMEVTQRGLVLVDDRGEALFCPAGSVLEATEVLELSGFTERLPAPRELSTAETVSGLDAIADIDGEPTDALPLAWATTEVDAGPACSLTSQEGVWRR